MKFVVAYDEQRQPKKGSCQEGRDLKTVEPKGQARGNRRQNGHHQGEVSNGGNYLGQVATRKEDMLENTQGKCDQQQEAI